MVVVMLVVCVCSLFAGLDYAKSSGNWNAATTWHSNNVPAATDSISIGGGFTVTVTANATIGKLTVGKSANPSGGAGTLVINSGVTLTVTGNVFVGDGANNGTIQYQTAGSGELSMTSSNTFLTFVTAGSSFSGASVIRRAVSGAGTWVFSSSNTRIVTSAGQGAINVLVKTYPNTFIPVGNSSIAIKRYLSVTPSGSLSGTFRFSYTDPGELNGLTESNLTAWAYNGTAWVNRGGSDVPASNYVEAAGIASWQTYWSAADPANPLPVQIASFSGNVETANDVANVKLEWMTVSETNNYGFYVERRAKNETDFTTLSNSFVSGNGTTLEQHAYSFTDANVAAGEYNYRLKQVDLDGLESYTSPIDIVIDKATGVKEDAVPAVFKLDQNYPNPFNPATTITFSVAETSPTTLKVYNLLGEEITTLFNGIATTGKLYTVNFSGANLISGIYFYRIESGKNISVHKMSLLK